MNMSTIREHLKSADKTGDWSMKVWRGHKHKYAVATVKYILCKHEGQTQKSVFCYSNFQPQTFWFIENLVALKLQILLFWIKWYIFPKNKKKLGKILIDSYLCQRNKPQRADRRRNTQYEKKSSPTPKEKKRHSFKLPYSKIRRSWAT